MDDKIKQHLLSYLAGGVRTALASQDRDTGRFLTPEGGWWTRAQDVVYPLSLLYTTEGTAWYQNEAVLEAIRKGGDALRDFQDPDGRWEFNKPDGSSWGRSYMPWTIYHWLEAFVLMQEHLGESRRQSWAEGLQLCYEGIAGELQLQVPVGHNIPNWHGMSLVRGSQVFQRPDWLEVGSRQCRFTSGRQHEDGYWPEGYGPTNGYNTIYVHALGLYYLFTGDGDVLDSLQRATHFNATFTYPDGSPVETIDGRQNYVSNCRCYGWPGFSLFPQGRRLISLIAGSLTTCKELNPSVGSFIHHGQTGDEAGLPWETQSRLICGDRALVRRRGPWFSAVSGYSAPPEARTALGRMRFINSRANCLSVWHESHGLLIGGGNSKLDPYFSTFDVGDKGARRMEPDTVAFTESDSGEKIAFHYGAHECLLTLHWPSEQVLEITFELPAKTRQHAVVLAGFTLRVKPGDELAWETGGTADEAELSALSAVDLDFANAGTVHGDGWALELPEETTFHWPAYPLNPYAIDGAAPVAEAVAAITIGFAANTRQTVVLTMAAASRDD